jgi:hypothetical protein
MTAQSGMFSRRLSRQGYSSPKTVVSQPGKSGSGLYFTAQQYEETNAKALTSPELLVNQPQLCTKSTQSKYFDVR